MMTGPIWQWGAADTARANREGRISCPDAVESALERLKDVNARVNAVTVDLSAGTASDVGPAGIRSVCSVRTTP